MAEQVSISRKGFSALLSEFVNGYPNPEDPTPPGPWDPIIRRAWGRIRWTSGPHPDPWLTVAPNPHPLPPRFAFAVAVAQEMIDQLSLTHTSAQSSVGTVRDERGPTASRLLRFVDDCGNGRIRRRWPFPWPPPDSEQNAALSANELIVMGMQFEDAAFEATNENLRRDFTKAGEKLIEMGLARM